MISICNKRFLLGTFTVMSLCVLTQFADYTRAAAAQFDPRLVDSRLCLSGPQAEHLVDIAARASTPLSLARGRTLNVAGDPQLQQHLTGLCDLEPSSHSIAYKNAIPTAFSAAMSAVAHFQATAQTSPKLSIFGPYTEIHIEYYGTKYILILASQRHDDPAPGIHHLGCSTSAAYRIAVGSGEVRPFDPCAEPHERTAPAFSELPDRDRF